MSHKVVKIESGTNYTGTTVSFDRSLTQIQTMLEKHNCSRIAVQKDMRGEVPMYTLIFEKAGLPYIIEFPIIYEKRKYKADKLRMDVSARIIHDRMKALLIEVEMNILDFSQGMMAFIAVPDAAGRAQAMQDYILDNRANIALGNLNLVQLPEGKS